MCKGKRWHMQIGEETSYPKDWVIAVCNRKFRSGVYLGENGNS